MMGNFGATLADRLSTKEGADEMNSLAGKVIFDRLREAAFSSGLLNMRPIQPSECQISEGTDTFHKIEFIEPNSRAMTMNFTANSRVRIIRAERAAMSFYTIASEIFQKTEQQLAIYRDIPVSQILEQNTLKDMQEIRDHGFLTHCESAVQAMQQEANSATVTSLNPTTIAAGTVVEFSIIKGEYARTASVNNAVPFSLQRPDLMRLKQTMSGIRMKPHTVVIPEVDLNSVDAWTLEDMGDKNQSETMYSGFTGNMLLGLKIVSTIKTDILRPGNVWLFAAPHFLGRGYLLNKTKFYVDKKYNVISWQAWEDLGMLLLNVNGVKKLELYSGDSSSLDADGIRSSILPKAERDLGAANNRVAEGVRFPQIEALLSPDSSPEVREDRLGHTPGLFLFHGASCKHTPTSST